MSARMDALRERLSQALLPDRLEVIDDGHRHVGHAGARDGRGHFSVIVVSAAFRGKTPVACHRMVYAAAGDLMETDIHALSIKALSPEEQT